MTLLALRSPWVVTGVAAKAAQSTASCCVRATRVSTSCGGGRIALEDGLCLPCRDGYRIERRKTRGRRNRVQAPEAGAQGAQALGGLQPQGSPHPALDVVHEDPVTIRCRVEHSRRYSCGSRGAVAGHLTQRVRPRSRPVAEFAAATRNDPRACRCGGCDLHCGRHAASGRAGALRPRRNPECVAKSMSGSPSGLTPVCLEPFNETCSSNYEIDQEQKRRENQPLSGVQPSQHRIDDDPV